MTTDNIADNAFPNTPDAAGSPPAAPQTLPASETAGADTPTQTPAADAVVDYSTLYPENHGLTPEQVKAQTELFKTANLSADAAKQLIDDRFSAVTDAIKKGSDLQIEKTKADWKAAQESLVQKGIEKFGDKLAEVKGYIPNAINRYLPKDEADQFTQFLEESGLHNDPRMITLLSAVGKSVSEDLPNSGQAPETKAKTTKANLYKNSNMNP